MTPETKRLYRSRDQRIILGVCGGLGDYFAVDPILFRLLFLLLQVTNGAGLLLYLVMVFIVPLEPGKEGTESPDLKAEAQELKTKFEHKAQEISAEFKSSAPAENHEETRGSYGLLGAIIVLGGVLFLLRAMFPTVWVSNDFLGALAIIALGLLIMFRR